MAKNDNPLSFTSFLNFINNNFSLLLIIAAVFVSGFAIGSMWKENNALGVQDQIPTADAPPPQDPGQRETDLSLLPPITDQDQTKGADNPTIYLVQYADYMCGFCYRVHSTLERLVDEFPNQLALVSRQFPILGEKSVIAAQVSQCVAEYGGDNLYWEFKEKLLTTIHEDNQPAELDNMLSIAAEVGADSSSIANCYESEEQSDNVNAQLAGGQAVGVQGVPATVIVTQDGPSEIVVGAVPYEEFLGKIEQYLN